MEYPRFFRLCWDNLLTLIGLNLLFLACSLPVVTLPASLTALAGAGRVRANTAPSMAGRPSSATSARPNASPASSSTMPATSAASCRPASCQARRTAAISPAERWTASAPRPVAR